MEQRSQSDAAALYLAGESTYNIAAKFGKSDTTIRNWLDELGVPRRSTSEAARLREIEKPKVDAETKRCAITSYLEGRTFDEAGREAGGVSGQSVRMWVAEEDKRSRSEATRRHRARRDAPLVAKLLSEAGACASPTCNDQTCEVESGRCHRTGCPRPALRARQTLAERRWVRNYPTKFCEKCYVGGAKWIDERPVMLRAVAQGHFTRWGSTVGFGRSAAEIAAAKGKKVGRRVRAAEAHAVASKAQEYLREIPTLSEDEVVDLLILKFRGREALKFPDDRRRPHRDATYQAARRWIERRLIAAGVDINPPSA